MLLKFRNSILSFTFLSLLILSSSCEKNDDTGPDLGQPWKEQINMGNFSINSGVIPTNEDGVSLDMLDDYVMESALPDVDFELMGIQAWIPTEEGLSTTITKARVRMATTSGVRTGNIYHDGFSNYKNKVNYNGTIYTVYEVFGFYDHKLGKIRPANFANVSFELEIEYEKNNVVVGSRMVTLGVYKR